MLAQIAAAAIAGASVERRVELNSHHVLVVTLYRELQTDDFRYDHRLILSVIRNRAANSDGGISAVCLKRWQFSYWNRFWADGKCTITPSVVEEQFSRVPKAFVGACDLAIIAKSVDGKINHFYSPKSMRPRFSVPQWASGKVPKYETKNFRFYAL